MIQITPISAFNDNYIWALGHPGNNACVVVDPGDADAVLNWLKTTTYQLAAILITHHHSDHVGGIEKLLKHSAVPVYGPAHEKIPHRDNDLFDGDKIYLADIDCHFNVIEVPGHTAGHIAYYNDDWLFCGDTLFAAGCGRLFEGTPEQMHQSLSRLAALPAATQVYCTHEYTLANLAFAALVEPDNMALKQRTVEATEQREMNMPTLPSTIGLELKTNPFLRSEENSVKQAAEQHIGHALDSATDVFAAIRQWKDNA